MSKQAVDERAHKDNQGFDLVANASSGDWSVWIDETPTGPKRRFAQIKGPLVYFSFEIASAEIIDELMQFLEEPPDKLPVSDQKTAHGFSLGGRKGMPITVIRDSEYKDRYFLMMGVGRGPVFRYSLQGADLFKLKKALFQVKEELKAEGLI